MGETMEQITNIAEILATVREQKSEIADAPGLGLSYPYVRYQTLHRDSGRLYGAWCKTRDELCVTTNDTGWQDTAIFGCIQQVQSCPEFPNDTHMFWLPKGDPKCNQKSE
jgi:hypothetical protein